MYMSVIPGDSNRKITVEFKDSLHHIVNLSLVWDTQKIPVSKYRRKMHKTTIIKSELFKIQW